MFTKIIEDFDRILDIDLSRYQKWAIFSLVDKDKLPSALPGYDKVNLYDKSVNPFAKNIVNDIRLLTMLNQRFIEINIDGLFFEKKRDFSTVQDIQYKKRTYLLPEDLDDLESDLIQIKDYFRENDLDFRTYNTIDKRYQNKEVEYKEILEKELNKKDLEKILKEEVTIYLLISDKLGKNQEKYIKNVKVLLMFLELKHRFFEKILKKINSMAGSLQNKGISPLVFRNLRARFEQINNSYKALLGFYGTESTYEELPVGDDGLPLYPGHGEYYEQQLGDQ